MYSPFPRRIEPGSVREVLPRALFPEQASIGRVADFVALSVRSTPPKYMLCDCSQVPNGFQSLNESKAHSPGTQVNPTLASTRSSGSRASTVQAPNDPAVNRRRLLVRHCGPPIFSLATPITWPS